MTRWLKKYIPAMLAAMTMCLPLLHGQGNAVSQTGQTQARTGENSPAQNQDRKTVEAQRSTGTVVPTVRASVTPDSISIGDHFTLEITVDKDIMQVVDFPAFKDRMVSEQFELLEDSPVDTLKQDGRRIELRKRYKLITFDEGYYGIGKIPVMWVDKNIVDTLYSVDSLRLTVTTFAVDTTKQTIYDIKPVAKAPFDPMEIIIYVLAYFLIVRPIIIGLSTILILRKRKSDIIKGKLRPSEPAHVTAIRNLEMLHNQKLWQNNKHKFYYTRLTDILREYIESRYDIGAMEMTSDAIMDALSDEGISQKHYAELSSVLHDADLVKFAKYVPEAEANEKAYYDAYYFIENTKPTEVEASPAGEDNELKPYE